MPVYNAVMHNKINVKKQMLARNCIWQQHMHVYNRLLTAQYMIMTVQDPLHCMFEQTWQC